ncbi:MAG: type II secretion system protein GspM [Myxococcaceae bacterium]
MAFSLPEPVQNLLANAQMQWAGLTARERRLVALAGSAVSLFIVFIVAFSMASGASAKRRRIADKQTRLQEAQLLAQSFREQARVREELEQRLTANDVRLITLLEEKGALAGLEIPTLTPKGEMPLGDGRITESAVVLDLSDVALGPLVSFLTRLEEGPGLVKVKRLRLEPRPSDEKLSVSATVATYRLKQP